MQNDIGFGTVLDGRYRLEGLLGSGSMGRVYEARHVKINRSYAIKLLHRHLLMDAKVSRRFAQEAELASALDHPNVVSVIDVGDCDEGHYLVMELARGVTLTHIIASAPLERPYAIDLLRQICDGLHHAHEKGAIHRDLKPDNVIVDKEGTVRIVDFGIATMNDDESSDRRERLTTEGLVLGTPQYMAPCIASGKPYDHRVDLFALGIIAYEMLTGQLPFDGEGAEVVRQNVTRATPLMGERVPTVVVDPLMEAFTHKLLAKEPDDRPRSALAARQLLDLIDRDPRAAAIELGVELPQPQATLLVVETAPPVKRRGKIALALALVALFGVVGYAALRDPTEPTAAVVTMPAAPVSVPVVVPSPPSPPVVVADVPAPIVAPAPVVTAPPPRAPVAIREAPLPPLEITDAPTADQLADLYVAVGKHLKHHPDDEQWARFRRIHFQQAVTTQANRNDAARVLAEIDRSLLSR